MTVIEHYVRCTGCDIDATIEEDEARHHMPDFTPVTLHEDGTADYKCDACGTVTRSSMDEETYDEEDYDEED